MKTLLVVYSYHHDNTLRIAEVFSKVLDADIVTPQQAKPQRTPRARSNRFWRGDR